MTHVCVLPLKLALTLGKITHKITVWTKSCIPYLSHVLTLWEIRPQIFFFFVIFLSERKIYPGTGLDKTLWLQKIHVPRTSRQSEHEGGEGGKGFKMYAPAAFTPQEIPLVLICVRSSVDPTAIVTPEGLNQQKMERPPSRNEPATFRFVRKCCKKCATEYASFQTVISEVLSRLRNTKQRSWLLHHTGVLWGHRNWWQETQAEKRKVILRLYSFCVKWVKRK